MENFICFGTFENLIFELGYVQRCYFLLKATNLRQLCTVCPKRALGEVQTEYSWEFFSHWHPQL